MVWSGDDYGDDCGDDCGDCGDDYISNIDSNRMFSGFIGDCKIFYFKSKFHVQKYDSTFSFVVSFQCTSIKVVSTVICNYQRFRHALVNQLLLRADPCGSLVQLID